MLRSFATLRTSLRARPVAAGRCFHSLGLSAASVQQLARLGLSQPTAAQQKAIPAILQGQDVVIAAETGGGKTLAYLLPVLDRLEQYPLPLDRVRLPVALILTSSTDLVRQIGAVLLQIKPELANSALVLSSAQQKLNERRRHPAPIVIATPRALMRASSPKDFAFTEMVVVDEADMLLSGGFEKDTKQLIATIRNQPVLRQELNVVENRNARVPPQQDGEGEIGDEDEEAMINFEDVSDRHTQTIFSAHATIPDYGKRSVRGFIEHKFPEAIFATTQDFHRTLPRLSVEWRELEKFAGTKGQNDSELELARLELLYDILQDVESNRVKTGSIGSNTLVFTNSITSANELFDFLKTEKSVPNCALFHKEVDRSERQQVLNMLDNSDANAVVVCTDIAARGLDTTKVGHVVQFEFANDVVSYLHRIGRTARAGSAGRVTNIVSANNELVLDKIRAAGAASLGGAFSRKRSLRKKAKKEHRERRTPSNIRDI